MILVWIGATMVLLKWLEIGPLATLSWWWVLSPLLAALVWFEGLERLFGRDKRQLEAAEYERQQKERVAKAFNKNGSSRARTR